MFTHVSSTVVRDIFRTSGDCMVDGGNNLGLSQDFCGVYGFLKIFSFWAALENTSGPKTSLDQVANWMALKLEDVSWNIINI